MTLIVQGVAQNGVLKRPEASNEGLRIPARTVERGMRGVHRASLRVIIPVPEGGEANKSEGGAIVGVWIHTSGWSIDPEAPEMRCSGERSFWSGALVGRRITVPEAPCLEAPLFAPVDLVFERSEPPFGGRGTQARARRSIGVAETIPGCRRFARAASSKT